GLAGVAADLGGPLGGGARGGEGEERQAADDHQDEQAGHAVARCLRVAIVRLCVGAASAASFVMMRRWIKTRDSSRSYGREWSGRRRGRSRRPARRRRARR